MRLADFLLDQLIRQGVTDIFGIPGGVVLDFLHAQDCRKHEMRAHLLCNEQDAAFAAIGYAQTAQRLGVAFATRGPGILNMVTAATDAYHDSVPLLIITAHAAIRIPDEMRVMDAQEIRTTDIFGKIVKEVVRVDDVMSALKCITHACTLAMGGRRGPVVLDVCAKLWKEEVSWGEAALVEKMARAFAEIKDAIQQAQRPVLLVGDGVHQANAEEAVRSFAERNQLPVLSSRGAQDIMPDSSAYFGYIGSHGLRYANFILSKTDCIVSLGNRLAFPTASKSFAPIFQKSKLLRVDIDCTEFGRQIPGSFAYHLDIRQMVSWLNSAEIQPKLSWLQACENVRQTLWEQDMAEPIVTIAKLLQGLSFCKTFVSDVGNHEFWVSRAFAYAAIPRRILYSRSFGVLGCSLGKAIGAYFSTHAPVACFCGDQGMQYGLPELQYIGHEKMPVFIVVLNNHSSGMIKTQQHRKYAGRYFLTTSDTGYGSPQFFKIAAAYGIAYHHIKAEVDMLNLEAYDDGAPHFFEMDIDADVDLVPYLPVGSPCQAMSPALSRFTVTWTPCNIKRNCEPNPKEWGLGKQIKGLSVKPYPEFKESKKLFAEDDRSDYSGRG